MYLLSKTNSKYLVLAFGLLIFLITIPLEDFFVNFILSFSKKILNIYQPQNSKLLELEKEVLSLSSKLKEMYYLKEENERLKKALQFKTAHKIDYIGVEVIAFDPSVWRRIIIVNAGSNRGIVKGMYVVNEDGYLVGKVFDVRKNYSFISLVNDIDFNLVVFIGKDSYGLLKGTLEGVKILYIENEDKINIADIVWFKIPNIDVPIYIGEIKNIRKDKENFFSDVDVKLYSENVVLRKIFIIKK